jgi:methylase of polypeptide subunit release factors
MGSLNKQYSREKLLGKVYTPAFIVEKILDDLKYDSPGVLGKRILDPACGDGQFLSEVVRRIIKFSPRENLVENLECVHGWDIDDAAVGDCICNLNRLVEALPISINWNIMRLDSIRKYKKHEEPDLFSSRDGTEHFDYIVGNPPYIRIQHLDKGQREYVQKNYGCCKNGSTDIYIAFYELCLRLLGPDGKCGLITPNTFLFTETARAMRGLFARHVFQITNYGDIQLFDKITTYSAIVLFDKNERGLLRYERATDARCFETAAIENKTLGEEAWQLGAGVEKLRKGRRLGDVCEIHVGLTTLCDKAYIFHADDGDGSVVIADTKHRGLVKIERKILRPIVKASRLKNSRQGVSEYILFPYEKRNGKHVIMEEGRLKEEFPMAHAYLVSVRELLDRRDNGRPNPVAWYAFGRTQGLETVWGEKILFSPINAKPNFIYYANPECAFYSGYCIKYDGDYQKLLLQLNSERMARFIAASSRDFRGGWKAYNKKTLERFEIEV